MAAAGNRTLLRLSLPGPVDVEPRPVRPSAPSAKEESRMDLDVSVPTAAAGEPLLARGSSPAPVTLSVNGRAHVLEIEPRVSLLDALREHLDLTGSKKGCDQ